ncbi:MAG TPA: NAD(P)-dependent oxidoreductase [Pseudolysinimonas sp.]|nr:NAD(P)-dependent oxidoreductase [Pseudolysinimonas sp.]
MSARWSVVFSARLGALRPEELALADNRPIDVGHAELGTPELAVTNGAGADILVVGAVEPMTREVLQALPRLKAIVRRGIGVDNVDLEAATELGIPVAFVPAASVEEVSDHALAIALTLARRLPGIAAATSADDAAAASALGNSARRLGDLTLGIVGFGRIGRALARKSASVFASVIAADPMLPEAETVDGVRIVGLSTLWGAADVISLHAPAATGSAPLVDATALDAMRAGVVLVNTARGRLVDEDALVAAVRSGKVAAAGLDVTAEEPVPASSPLREVPGILLTGHTAAKGALAAVSLQRAVIAAIEALVDTREPEFIANPAVLSSAAYRPTRPTQKESAE